MSSSTPSASRCAAEAMIEKLNFIGRSYRNPELVDTMERYARDLIQRVSCSDEGMTLRLASQPFRVVAQHVIDLELWYIVATDGKTVSRIILREDRSDHEDAIRALEWMKNDNADQIVRVVG